MSKNTNNVNPDHYKTAGREPQGQAVVHDVLRQQFAETKAREKRGNPKFGAKTPGEQSGTHKDVSSKKDE